MSVIDAPIRAQGLNLRHCFFAVALCMALIEFGQVWFFDADDRGLITTRPYGGAYRALLWLTCCAGLALHSFRSGLIPLLVIIAPSLAFMIWGAAGTLLWSADLVISMRTLIFWTFAIGISAAAGYEVPPRLIARVLGTLFVAVFVASVGLFIINPDAATGYWYDQLVFRGLFPQKNLLGWFMAIGLIVLLSQKEHFSRLELSVAILLLLTGLVLSGSASAIVIAISVIGYMIWLRAIAALLNDGTLGFLATLIGFMLAVGAVIFLFPLILEALGRDLTLTGRTDVWGHYLSYIKGNFSSGFGPGLLSGTSPLTIAIGNSIPGHEQQGLFSAHSIFITILGEVGVIGLCLFLGGLIYVAFIAPFRHNDVWAVLAAGMAMAILISGVTESRDGYVPGIASMIMFLARAQLTRKATHDYEAWRGGETT